jgi:F-type H+-transporting ATPase subunit epsilon
MFQAHIVHVSDKVLHDGQVERVSLPGVLGEFEVVDRHVPIVSLLAKGALSVFAPEVRKAFAIKQGLVRFDGLRLFAVVE